jgi:hypothetical protein
MPFSIAACADYLMPPKRKSHLAREGCAKQCEGPDLMVCGACKKRHYSREFMKKKRSASTTQSCVSGSSKIDNSSSSRSGKINLNRGTEETVRAANYLDVLFPTPAVDTSADVQNVALHCPESVNPSQFEARFPLSSTANSNPCLIEASSSFENAITTSSRVNEQISSASNYLDVQILTPSVDTSADVQNHVFDIQQSVDSSGKSDRNTAKPIQLENLVAVSSTAHFSSAMHHPLPPIIDCSRSLPQSASEDEEVKAQSFPKDKRNMRSVALGTYREFCTRSDNCPCDTCQRRLYMRLYSRKRRASERLSKEDKIDGSDDLSDEGSRPNLVPTTQTVQKIVDNAIERLSPTGFLKDVCDRCYRLVDRYQMNDKSVCIECARSIAKGETPRHSITNGFDFGEIPPQLQDLTLLEEMLISQARPRFTIVRLKMGSIQNSNLLTRAIKSNVIAFPQDLSGVYNALTIPLRMESAPEFIKVILSGKVTVQQRISAISKFGRVRRQRVIDAVIWKKNNDPYFASVNIDIENRTDLPEDGIPLELTNSISEISDDLPGEEVGQDSQDDVVQSVSGETVGYVDFSGLSVTETQLENLAFEKVVLKVPHGTDPINTYDDAFWAGAFPTLFPYGRGLPREERLKNIGFREWLLHCLQYKDRRFRLHPTFLFVAYNLMKVSEVCRSVRIRCTGQTAKDFGDTLRNIEPKKILEIAEKRRSMPYEEQDPLDLPVLALLRQVQVTGAPVLGSVHSKVHRRNELRALMVMHGLPSIWLTLNPSELTAPLLPLLSGLSEEVAKQLNSFDRMKLAAEDPVSVAEFFSKIMDVVFESVISKGLLGDYVTHYGVVETQDRGGLHLHALVWISGLPSVSILKQQMDEDDAFKRAVFEYRDSIIMECLIDTPEHVKGAIQNQIDSANLRLFSDVCSEEFMQAVSHLARLSNMHRKTHSHSCRKYRNSECRFNFPRPLVEETFWDSATSSVIGKRNEEWINCFNAVLMYLFRCNHDIQWLSTSNDSMALVYYITDYATKNQLKSYEVLNLIAAALEKTRAVYNGDLSNVSSEEISRLSLIKCINKIGASQEISGPLCALHVLYQKETFTPENFVHIKWMPILKWYKEHFATALARRDESVWDDDDVLILDGAECSFSNLRIDYMFRGQSKRLQEMSLYFYAATVYKTKSYSADDAVEKRNCAKFLRSHTQSSTHVQHIRLKGAYTPVFLGRKFPDAETETDDYYALLMLLFKPWAYNVPLKDDGAVWSDAYKLFFASSDNYAGNPHHERYGLPSFKKMVENINLLKKCKDAADATRSRRKTQQAESLSSINEGADVTDQFAAYDSQEDVDPDTVELADNSEITVLQLKNISSNSSAAISSELFQVTALEKIAVLVDPKGFVNEFNSNNEPGLVDHSDVDSDGWKSSQSQNDSEEAVVESLAEYSLNTERIVRNRYSIPEEILRLLAPELLLRKILQSRSLNTEQARAVAVIAKHEFEASETQLLMYVGGLAGTGKSEIIKSVEEYFALRRNWSALRLSASTGTAARKFGGSTIHSLCKFSKSKGVKSSGAARLTKSSRALIALWTPVSYVIIDECSMISAALLFEIHETLQFAKGNSQKPFGGVNIILAGDFFQFPPVLGMPLYASLPSSRPQTEKQSSSILGLGLWNQFTTVVMLRQNFRQRLDPLYQGILTRYLDGTLTDDDFAVLRSRIIKRGLVPPPDTIIIVNRNSLRVRLNTHFVKSVIDVSKCETLQINAVDKCSNPDFPIRDPEVQERLLSMDDNNTEGLPGVLLIFKGMRCMVTDNVDVSGGLANGSIVTIFDWAPVAGDDIHPKYILVKVHGMDCKLYPGLPEGVMPIFTKTKSFMVPLENRQKASISISRMQFPIVPAYSITDYKSQGDSLKHAVLDIRKPPTGNWQCFFALYVLLSRVASLDGLFIVCNFDVSVFKQRPPEEIQTLVNKLDQYDVVTKDSTDLSFLYD